MAHHDFISLFERAKGANSLSEAAQVLEDLSASYSSLPDIENTSTKDFLLAFSHILRFHPNLEVSKLDGAWSVLVEAILISAYQE